MKAAGLPTPKNMAVKKPEDLPRAAEVVGFPAVLKPTSGAASLGVVKVETLGDLDRYPYSDPQLGLHILPRRCVCIRWGSGGGGCWELSWSKSCMRSCFHCLRAVALRSTPALLDLSTGDGRFLAGCTARCARRCQLSQVGSEIALLDASSSDHCQPSPPSAVSVALDASRNFFAVVP